MSFILRTLLWRINDDDDDDDELSAALTAASRATNVTVKWSIMDHALRPKLTETRGRNKNSFSDEVSDFSCGSAAAI